MALGVTAADEYSKEDTCDVRVEDGRPLAKREASNGPCRICADPFERAKCLFIGRQLAAVSRHRLAGDRVQTPWPNVVTERVPGLGHFPFGRCRERLQRRVLLEPLDILGQHPVYLRLLQHDLGNENMVGVRRVPPRQVATMTAVPLEQSLAETASLD